MSPHSHRSPTRRSAVVAVVLACLAPLLALTFAAAPADAAGLNLHRGSHGASVRLLESRLHRLGLLVASAVDGRYRAATVNSVKRFQRLHRVPVTGRVNRNVWNRVGREVYLRSRAARGPAPSIIGHRGSVRPGLAENTLQSLRFAHGYADVLEFDLRLTADREIVLMHDATLDRTTNCTGALTSWTLADLRARCTVNGQPIPTFQEVAEYAATVPEQIAPELKNQDFGAADIAKVVDLLDQNGLTGRTLVQSFTPGVLARVHSVRPELATVLASRTPPSVSAIRGTGSTRVAVDMANLTATQAALYKRNGLKVWTFTARNRAALVTARSLGVSAVVTDVPRQARNYY